jgi:hypothetical protein
MSHQDKRKIRVEYITNLIRIATREQKFVDKEKLISHMSFKYGVARRTTLEYLKDLINLGFIKLGKEGLSYEFNKEIQEVLNE